MSDWMDIPDNPTLAVHYPWDKRPSFTCLNCNKTVGSVNASVHSTLGWPDMPGEPGCGIRFKCISTAAADQEWIEHVKNMRPDLEWKTVRWG